MSLSDLASLGSFVSGMAILVSLIYVALQLRQAAKHQRALTVQGGAARNSALIMNLADPLAGLWNKIVTVRMDLDPVEITQINTLCLSLFRAEEEAFAQHQQKLLPDHILDSEVRTMKTVLQFPAMRAGWKTMRGNFQPDFAASVDEMLRTTMVVPPNSAQTIFNEAFKAETAHFRQ